MREAQRRVDEYEQLITKQKVRIFFKILGSMYWWRDGEELNALDEQQTKNRAERDRLKRLLTRL